MMDLLEINIKKIYIKRRNLFSLSVPYVGSALDTGEFE